MATGQRGWRGDGLDMAHGWGRRTDHAARVEICRRYTEDGETLDEVGQGFGLSGGAIGQVLRDMGVQARPPVRRPQMYDQEAIRADYETVGLTIREICRNRRMSSKTVSRILTDLGVQMRSTGRRPAAPDT